MSLTRVVPLTITENRQEVLLQTPELGQKRIWIEADSPLVSDLTPWIALIGPVASRLGHALAIDGLVDATALQNAAAALRQLYTWYPGQFRQIAISSPDVERLPELSSEVGCFFSGGVDSFFSVVRNRGRIKHLVFVQGFDVRIEQEDLGFRVQAELSKAAKDLGLPLVTVRTNIREVTDPIGLEWGGHYHGAALGGISQALGALVGRILVPSSFPLHQLRPWGSHPELDPLWSSSRLIVEHDGVEYARHEKVRGISQDPVAMRSLRVCWENPNGSYNCGNCNKCQRTKVSLRIVGAKCASMPGGVDLSRLPQMATAANEREHMRAQLADSGIEGDPSLARALRYSVSTAPLRHRIGKLRAEAGRFRRRVLARR